MDRARLVFLKNRMERVMMDGNGAVAWEKWLRDKIVELLEILTEREPRVIVKTKEADKAWRDYFVTLIKEGLKGLEEHNL